MPQLDLSKGNVPSQACRFAADVEVGTNGDGAKTAPITIVARTGDPVNNYWWGAIVHDLDGMTVAKPRIPLDYCHDDDEVIGYANRFDTSTGDLVASGALVPYSADPEDKAAEVLYKSQNGIPYQASIFFDGPLVLEDVGPGAVSSANGRQVAGPATIVRQWTLRGIAICPYGVDGDTSVEMKFGGARDVPVRFVTAKQETKKMSATAEAEVKPVEGAAVEAQASTDTVPAETAAVAENAENKDEAATAVTAETAATVESAATETATTETAAPVVEATAGAMSDRKIEGKKFRDAFGDKGPEYFSDGLSFADAQIAFGKFQTEEIKRLSKENGDLKTQMSASRGEKDPVSFSADAAADGSQNGGGDPRNKNLGVGGLRKFADNIRFVEEQSALKKK